MYVANPDDGDETVVDDSGVVEKRKAKVKVGADGSAPVQTKAVSAYWHFCAEQKEAVKAANPDITVAYFLRLFFITRRALHCMYTLLDMFSILLWLFRSPS